MFNKTPLPEKGKIYSNLNMEDVTDLDYMYAKRVCKDFEIKKLGEYLNLFLKNDTYLLPDVFKNFRKICFKFCELDPVKFYSAFALAQQAPLLKTEVKLKLSTYVDMLLMIEKGIRGGICHAVH